MSLLDYAQYISLVGCDVSFWINETVNEGKGKIIAVDYKGRSPTAKIQINIAITTYSSFWAGIRPTTCIVGPENIFNVHKGI